MDDVLDEAVPLDAKAEGRPCRQTDDAERRGEVCEGECEEVSHAEDGSHGDVILETIPSALLHWSQ